MIRIVRTHFSPNRRKQGLAASPATRWSTLKLEIEAPIQASQKLAKASCTLFNCACTLNATTEVPVMEREAKRKAAQSDSLETERATKRQKLPVSLALNLYVLERGCMELALRICAFAQAVEDPGRGCWPQANEHRVRRQLGVPADHQRARRLCRWQTSPFTDFDCIANTTFNDASEIRSGCDPEANVFIRNCRLRKQRERVWRVRQRPGLGS